MLTRILLSGTTALAGMLYATAIDETPPGSLVKDEQRSDLPRASRRAERSSSDEVNRPQPKAIPVTAGRRSPDEAAIQLVDEAFIKAYNAGDAEGLAAQFTEHAEYVDETGAVVEGRKAIEASLTLFFEENPGCRLQINAESVRTLSPGVAVQDGTTVVSRTDNSTPVECHYTSVYVKTEGKWLLASVRDSAPRNLREHSMQLQQLSWLNGNWIDEGDDSIINFSCESVDNGNFLLRKFTVIVEGEEAMSGTQRIGWDPLTGKLRAWIFDSEGAYGEGLWHHDPANNRWVLKTTGVTADGETASSTSLYTFVNEHTMTWQSVDHEIAGVQQPDSDVITIVRHAPAPTPASTVDADQ